MTDINAFSCAWTQPSDYWIIVEGAAAKQLEGFTPAHTATLYARNVGAQWPEEWAALSQQLAVLAPNHVGVRAAVIASPSLPTHTDITHALKSVTDIHAIAESLWLVQDVREGRLGCYMQKVLDRRGKLVGYEAFARMESRDGGVIGGGAVMHAARVLHTEYQVDRLLHKHAVESFVTADLDGYIFINFLTGFIQRPEVYLEGLSSAATKNHVRSGAVVLDVPLRDYARDLPKLKSIAEYCRSRGFALALDDVITDAGLAALLADIRPAFVKLDGKFGHGMAPAKRDATLREIVRLSHAVGANVLAEGIETEATRALYFDAGVDMFQGYLIGAPERLDAPLRTQANA